MLFIVLELFFIVFDSDILIFYVIYLKTWVQNNNFNVFKYQKY